MRIFFLEMFKYLLPIPINSIHQSINSVVLNKIDKEWNIGDTSFVNCAMCWTSGELAGFPGTNQLINQYSRAEEEDVYKKQKLCGD